MYASLYRPHAQPERYTIIVRTQKVFAMYAAVEHNTTTHITSLAQDEYEFANEDDAIAFEEEMWAYIDQQNFLEGLDDDELTALCIR